MYIKHSSVGKVQIEWLSDYSWTLYPPWDFNRQWDSQPISSRQLVNIRLSIPRPSFRYIDTYLWTYIVLCRSTYIPWESHIKAPRIGRCRVSWAKTEYITSCRYAGRYVGRLTPVSKLLFISTHSSTHQADLLGRLPFRPGESLSFNLSSDAGEGGLDWPLLFVDIAIHINRAHFTCIVRQRMDSGHGLTKKILPQVSHSLQQACRLLRAANQTGMSYWLIARLYYHPNHRVRHREDL